MLVPGVIYMWDLGARTVMLMISNLILNLLVDYLVGLVLAIFYVVQVKVL